jgi:hypothetical protein
MYLESKRTAIVSFTIFEAVKSIIIYMIFYDNGDTHGTMYVFISTNLYRILLAKSW